MQSDDEFQIRPGKGRLRGSGQSRKATTLVGQVMQLAQRSGTGICRSAVLRSGGTGPYARGRRAALTARRYSQNRRVLVKARIVKRIGLHSGAPLSRHTAYLEREGVTRDGENGRLFDSHSDEADGKVFAERCDSDRHHFRFIVSPEDAAQMDDVRAFTRELMADVSDDLDSKLDWVAVDHWNTDNPHIHILLRGKVDDGKDLVIAKDYIREGMRARAEERVTIELGPRTERELAQALTREVEADRWTSLDRSLQRIADHNAGIVDLRPGDPGADPTRRNLMIGRATKLERLGLADKIDPARWTLKPGLESTLRDLAVRGDIIKTMHRAMTAQGRDADLSAFALHGGGNTEPIIGRLVERGLHDELVGNAYAIVDGVDGRTHHLRFADLDMTGDAKPGAIVELRSWEATKGKTRLSLATRSDLSLGEQLPARGATWLDRQLVAKDGLVTGNGFGAEVRNAMEQRSKVLINQGLAKRDGGRITFARDLIETLKSRELVEAASRIAKDTGLVHQPYEAGDRISGTFSKRVTLSSGRFAMIDDGMGFQLVPWRPALDRYLGQHVTGSVAAGGGIEWSLGRSRGLGI